jgi:hypothetical protein
LAFGRPALTDIQDLRPALWATLGRFHGRDLGHALLVEMAEVLNDELAPWRDGRRIRLVWEEPGVCVHLDPEGDPEIRAETCPPEEASDGWTSRTPDPQACV